MDKTAKQKAMELLKPPFRLQRGYIFDSAERTNTVADDGDCELGTMARLRGWGRLGYLEDGAEIQDAIGEIIAEALNQYFAPNAQGAAAQSEPINIRIGQTFKHPKQGEVCYLGPDRYYGQLTCKLERLDSKSLSKVVYALWDEILKDGFRCDL